MKFTITLLATPALLTTTIFAKYDHTHGYGGKFCNINTETERTCRSLRPTLSHACVSLTHIQVTELELKICGVLGTSMSSNAATGSGSKSRGATGTNIVTSSLPFLVYESY
jgi:hypothetical protein